MPKVLKFQNKQREWYRENIDDVISYFGSTKNGLTDYRYAENVKKYGQNILSDQKPISYFEIFISQFKSPLIYVLFFCSGVVFYLGDYVDASIILGIVFLNAIIGTFQEGKAQDTLLALKKVIKSYANVIRNGSQSRIPDYELVSGDIIVLKDGDSVPADARIISANSLQVNESSLTGESETVLKHAEKISATSLANPDQKNMLFRGTYVVSGLATAIVVRIGNETVIGRIAAKLSELHVNVPLKKNISNLSNLLVVSILIISIGLFFIGINTGKSASEMFVTVVALAVSAIPEGLPVVVTMVLASGVWRMAKQNVLVKKLQAVEALGQAKILALDKTGTITQNQMMVEKVFVNDRYLSVTGFGYSPTGKVYENKEEVKISKDLDLELVSKISTLTSIAKIVQVKSENNWRLEMGDPTEGALMAFGQKTGLDKNTLLHEHPLIKEFPFEFETKHHTTINVFDKKEFLSCAGSPEVVLSKCTNIWSQGKVKKMSEYDLANIHEAMKEFANDGYRVLTLACDFTPNKNVTSKNINDLTFVGLVAIADAVRPEVYESVKIVKNAGIKPVMITGDFRETAIAIAKKVGIYEEGDEVITGVEITELQDDILLSKLEKVSVFARVSPEDKMKIIELYKRAGLCIAMTGDGINDALSLTAADLGVSMGQGGSEVAKEASDIVLLDDNFASIVQAAEEGRNIYLTIKNAILYLLSTNLGEILVISVTVIFGLPLPILASQIIWLNLVTDACLVVMLAFDKREKNILNEKFVKPNKFIVDTEMLFRIVSISLVMLATSLYIFAKYLDQDLIKVWTMTLTMLTVIQWYNIFNVRSKKKTVFSKDTFNNKYILFGLALAITLHLSVMYIPQFGKILQITPLNFAEWGLILVLGSLVIFVEEIRKLFYRLRIVH